MNSTLSKLFYGALIATTITTTGAAVSKLTANGQIKTDEKVLSKSQTTPRIAENETNTSNKESENDGNQKSTSADITTNNSLPSFTLAQLATHNTAASCYVAHNGIVYDLTNVSVWANCTHHGATGGIDITPFFPHPISYLTNLNKVGVLASGSSGQISPINQNNKSHKSDLDDRDEIDD